MSQKPSAGAQSSLIRPHGPSGRSSEPSNRAAWPQLTSVAACVCAGDDSCTAVNAVHCAEHGSSSDDRRASGSPSQRLPDWMKLASMSRAGRPSLTLLSESTTVNRGALRRATCATRDVYAVSLVVLMDPVWARTLSNFLPNLFSPSLVTLSSHPSCARRRTSARNKEVSDAGERQPLLLLLSEVPNPQSTTYSDARSALRFDLHPAPAPPAGEIT